MAEPGLVGRLNDLGGQVSGGFWWPVDPSPVRCALANEPHVRPPA
ncbi:hypothetical protein [Streptomyces sp. NBC_01718]